VVIGAAAYVLTLLTFQGLIQAPEDVATVAGAVGGLFTFLGTLAGAFFGIKSTQDTTDKADARSREDAERTREATEKARKASLMVNPQDPNVNVQDLL
jgi:hypothetical protein